MCGRFALAISQEELSGYMRIHSLIAHFAELHRKNNNDREGPDDNNNGGPASSGGNNSESTIDDEFAGDDATDSVAGSDQGLDMGSAWPGANYNTAPGQFSPVIQLSSSPAVPSHLTDNYISTPAANDMVDVDVRPLHWGFKSVAPGMSTFNARSETISSSPLWRRAGRCIVPADGYYEWFVNGESKTLAKVPYYVHSAGTDVASGKSTPKNGSTADQRSKSLLWMAGLVSPDGKCFSIVTTAAQGSSVEWLHHRVPVLLNDPIAWLKEGKAPLPPTSHGTNDLACKKERPKSGIPANGSGNDGLAWHRVGPDIGSVRNHGPQLCKPYVEKSRLLTSFYGKAAAESDAASTAGPAKAPSKTAEELLKSTTEGHNKRKNEALAISVNKPQKKAKTTKSNAKITSFFKQK